MVGSAMSQHKVKFNSLTNRKQMGGTEVLTLTSVLYAVSAGENHGFREIGRYRVTLQIKA